MVMLTGLPRVLKDAGVAYTLVPGWATRTAHPGGIIENRATFWHTSETADAAFRNGANAPTLDYVTNGLGYPLYNILFGRNGHTYLIAAGTAAHAGLGSISGIPTNNGNRYALGFSFDANNRGYPVTAAQLEAGVRVGAAIDREWRRAGKGRHIMHGEYAPARRSDPTRVPGGWSALRAAIQRGYWAIPPVPAPAPKPAPAPAPTPTTNPEPKEWTDMATKEEVQAAVQDAITTALQAHRAEKTVTWRDSVSGETKRFTVDEALGYLSLHWVRELERDTTRDAQQASAHAEQ